MYEVFTGLPEPRGLNIGFLSGFRQDRFSPSGEAITAIVAVFADSAGGLALRTGVYRAAKATGLPSELMLAHVYHLLWTHRLTIDLDAALTRDMVVSAP